MTLADSNIWLALSLSGHVFHNAAEAWFLSQSKSSKVAFCRSTQHSYLRLLTTAAVVSSYGIAPLSNDDAWLAYQGWQADARVTYLDEPAGIEATWQTLAARKSASPKVWMDAYLAAFAMAGGLQLVTTDKDFKQFNGLNLVVL